MDPTRRNILATGVAAPAMAAAPRLFPLQTGQGGSAMAFYEKGAVRIRYEEAGSGFPLLLRRRRIKFDDIGFDGRRGAF